METPESSQRGAGGKAAFEPTLWTMVLEAGQTDEAGIAAFNRLAQVYWYPVYAFIRRSGRSHEDAQDLAQAFFLRLWENRALAGVHPEKGRFRSFLLTALRNFLITEWHRAQAQCRGGEYQFVSLDAEEDETRFQGDASLADPVQAYDRDVALMVINGAMASLAGEYSTAGRAPLFEALRPYLAGAVEEQSYETVAASLAMTTPAVKMASMRLRRRFAEALRLEVAQLVFDRAEVETELRHLLAALCH